MGGRGSSSRSLNDDSETFYQPLDSGNLDLIGDDGHDNQDNAEALNLLERWLLEKGEDLLNYLTEPLDPNSPAGKYFAALQDPNHDLTQDETEFLFNIVLGFGPGALSQGPVTIAGSRSIPAAVLDRIERMAAALSRAGCTITTGCAKGVDEVFAKYAKEIFAIFDANGKGAISASNVKGVLDAEKNGALVHYLAGGELNVPVVARLANRSDQTAKASDTLVGIFTNEISKGTTRELKEAARQGKHVFALSTTGNELPRLDAIGHWEPVENARGIWEGLHRWVKSELPLAETTGPRVLNKYKDKIGPEDVYIGRPSEWGNPFKMGPNQSREDVIQKYQEYIESTPGMLEKIRKLKGKNLVCFCSPKPCHGDILLKLANKK